MSLGKAAKQKRKQAPIIQRKLDAKLLTDEFYEEFKDRLDILDTNGVQEVQNVCLQSSFIIRHRAYKGEVADVDRRKERAKFKTIKHYDRKHSIIRLRKV